ncbi:MAG TPA: endonuclease [Crocinitomix sp.]|nr:endonuclease [Crocinitomix sp.]
MKLFFLFLFINLQLLVFGQNPQQNNSGVRVMFYNVENLFHPSNDSLKNDDEFTPQGQRYWSYRRYNQKLNNIAKTIIAVGEWEAPAIIGLCEIENIQCLTDLVGKSPLKKFGYQIIHYECADKRGIDVALLYRSEYFTPISSQPFVVNFGPNSRPTRDILYVKGIVNGNDTLHCFVNHWPSRYGGQLATAPKREKAAQVLRHKYDSILSINPNANIIAMGDFNDHPDDVSMKDILKAKKDTVNLSSDDLVNLIWHYAPQLGTHKFQHIWGVLDQFVVTQSLVFGHNNLYAPLQNAKIFKAPWLLENDDVGQKLNRTYVGFKYHGGYSDHLPIYVDIIFRTFD